MEIDKKEYMDNMDYLHKISMWLIRKYEDDLYERFGIDKNDIFAVMKMLDAIYEEQCKEMPLSWYCYGFGNKEE